MKNFQMENVFNKVYQSIEEPKGEREGQEPTKDQDRLKRYAGITIQILSLMLEMTERYSS